MGSFRGRVTAGAIIAALICAPFAAHAEVCDKVRPDWLPGTATTQFGEALFLLTTLPLVVLLFLTALVAIWRSKWATILVVMVWGLVVALVLSEDPTGIQAHAMREGCVGLPNLFVGSVAALGLALLLNAFHSRHSN